MKKILFICTGNTCRSAMAEAFLNKLISEDNLKDKICCVSAGIAAVPGTPATLNTIEVMNEKFNIDLSLHSASNVNPDELADADLIFTMTSNIKEYIMSKYPETDNKVFLLKEYTKLEGQSNVFFSKYDISDPYGMPKQVYVQCAQEIKSEVDKLLINIKKEF